MSSISSFSLPIGARLATVFALAVAGTVLPSAPVYASTVWYNTDSNFNATNLSYLIGLLFNGSCGSGTFCTNGITSFGIFRPGNTSLNPSLGYLPVNAKNDTISFSSQSPNLSLSNLNGNTFTLYGSNKFLLGATTSPTPSSGAWVGDSGYRTITPGSQYYVLFPAGSVPPATLEATDIAPVLVRLPAALWLFVSGIFGLVCVARRRVPSTEDPRREETRFGVCVQNPVTLGRADHL